MKIHWKKRLKNKVWLAAVISGAVLAAQGLLPLFGVDFDGGKILDACNGILAVLVGLGVIVDPTSEGMGD